MALAEAVLTPGYTYPKVDGSKSAMQLAADKIGMSRKGLEHRINNAYVRLGMTLEGAIADLCKPLEDELENIPDGFEVLNAMAEANTKAIAAARAKPNRLCPVRKEPFAVAIFGDPHLDNKGCNLAQLRDDVLTAKAAGFRCISIGDLLDNFHATGKLAAKQAHNRLSVKEGLALARWFVRDSGVRWDAQILGNHDAWLDFHGCELMSSWAREAGTKFYDWQVNIRYEWDGGHYTIMAAHDFKGSSIFNPLHGAMRRAREDGTADAYVCGHRHNAAKAGHENAFRGRRYEYIRVKGYKDADDYAFRKGFEQQREGHSAVIVIDPWAESMEGRATIFHDFERAAAHLTMLRGRDAA